MKLALMITAVIIVIAVGFNTLLGRLFAPTNPVPRYHEFRLDDGTRCVITYRGAVDCDWRKK